MELPHRGNSNLYLQIMSLKIRKKSILNLHFQVPCPLSLTLVNIPNCQLVFKFLSLYYKLFKVHESYISKFEFMNYLFANLLVAWL